MLFLESSQTNQLDIVAAYSAHVFATPKLLAFCKPGLFQKLFQDSA